MGRGRKLDPASTRDTDWQRAEYARLMGEEVAARQEMATRLANKLCTCRGFKGKTVKNRGVFRTIHEHECAKWKPWMSELEEELKQRYSQE